MHIEESKNVRIAFSIVGVLVLPWLIGCQQRQHPFVAVFILGLTLLFSIGLASGFLVMRLFRIKPTQLGWAYPTVGLINFLYGIINLFFYRCADAGWLVTTLNLVLGASILYDLFWWEKK